MKYIEREVMLKRKSKRRNLTDYNIRKKKYG
jgi:hypothetical protein